MHHENVVHVAAGAFETFLAMRPAARCAVIFEPKDAFLRASHETINDCRILAGAALNYLECATIGERARCAGKIFSQLLRAPEPITALAPPATPE